MFAGAGGSAQQIAALHAQRAQQKVSNIIGLLRIHLLQQIYQQVIKSILVIFVHHQDNFHLQLHQQCHHLLDFQYRIFHHH